MGPQYPTIYSPSYKSQPDATSICVVTCQYRPKLGDYARQVSFFTLPSGSAHGQLLRWRKWSTSQKFLRGGPESPGGPVWTAEQPAEPQTSEHLGVLPARIRTVPGRNSACRLAPAAMLASGLCPTDTCFLWKFVVQPVLTGDRPAQLSRRRQAQRRLLNCEPSEVWRSS